MNNQLNFSTNWAGKLNNPEYFTTLRIESNKYFVGAEFDVLFTKCKEERFKILGTAKVVAVARVPFIRLSDSITFIDTGYNVEETKKILKTMYKEVDFTKKDLFFISLKWIERKNFV